MLFFEAKLRPLAMTVLLTQCYACYNAFPVLEPSNNALDAIEEENNEEQEEETKM